MQPIRPQMAGWGRHPCQEPLESGARAQPGAGEEQGPVYRPEGSLPLPNPRRVAQDWADWPLHRVLSSLALILLISLVLRLTSLPLLNPR